MVNVWTGFGYAGERSNQGCFRCIDYF